MDVNQFEVIAPGTVVYVKNDGKQYQGAAGKFSKLSDKGNAGLMIAGRLVWINPERLERVKNG